MMDTQHSGTQMEVSSEIDFASVPRRTMDIDLQQFYENNKLVEEISKEKNYLMDNSLETQSMVSMIANPNAQAMNRRSVTWNIPRLDLIWRSSPYVKRAVDWISSKSLIKGIDINSQDDGVTSKELSMTQQKFKTLYRPMQKVVESGLVYGGSAGLIILNGRQTEEDFMNPLIIKTIKKDQFLGIKPLSRWYQIEPALDKPLITLSDIGEHSGLLDAELLGQPKYYRVNLSGGLSGFSGNNSMEIKTQGFKMQGSRILVHRSWLLLFNPYSLSHIETQIERYWSSSIIETASVDLERHEIIWSATAKSAVKNNIGIVNIDGFDSTLMNEHSKKIVNEKINLMKYTTNHGLIAMGIKDKFMFAQSSLAGNEKAIEQSMRQVATAFGVPVNVLFGSNDVFDEESYLQSLYGVENIQEKELRPSINTLIQIVYRSLFGKQIRNYDFEFKPIMTLTQEQKATVIKIMIEAISVAYEDEAISLLDYQKMLNDVANNPSNIFHQISEEYIDQVLEGDEDGKIITSRTKQIEIAKVLNQLQMQSMSKKEKKKGLSGVKSPESSSVRVKKGGNPNKSEQPLGRNPLNRKKGKE